MGKNDVLESFIVALLDGELVVFKFLDEEVAPLIRQLKLLLEVIRASLVFLHRTPGWEKHVRRSETSPQMIDVAVESDNTDPGQQRGLIHHR